MKSKFNIAITLIISLVLIGLIASLKAESFLKGYLSSHIQKLSQDHYELTIDKLDISLVPLGFKAHNLILSSTDSTYLSLDSGLHVMPTIAFGALHLNRLNLYDILFRKKLTASVHVAQAHFNLVTRNHAEKTVSLQKKDNDTQFLFRVLTIEDAEVEYRDTSALLSAKFDLDITDISSKYINRSLRRSLALKARQVVYHTGNELYKITCDTMTVDAYKRTIALNHFSLKNKADKYELGQLLGHEADWYDLKVDKISITNDKPFFQKDSLQIDSLTIKGLSANIFRDKRLQFPSIPNKALPHELIENISMPLMVNSVLMSESDITYEEHVKGSPKAGSVSFSDLSVKGEGITNFYPDSTITLNASALLMGKGLLELRVNIPQAGAGLPYVLSGYIHEQQMTALNPMLNYVAKVTLISGQLKTSRFNFTHDAHTSSGEMHLLYDNLKMKFINPAGSSTLGKLDESIKTFVANTLIIKKSNLDDKDMRVGIIEYERDPKKSLFNFWWKSLLSGIKSSTGIKEAQ
ncbi:hypothetical protein FNH22_05430 [Fulvivirga sp. M361]|uniref:hypothetical protein n=1 Tax=Fulvivirga sp. M361 TaxID=2594266 RepID=UPI00117A95A9|nr:hypothetical protein [Fulvivirga sp. M361]TRX60493.1 hypothetical protein FNH22_05430 [Fulvivirga sp. M361]